MEMVNDNRNNCEIQVNLSNDLMFHLVMQDEERCRELLEMILDFPISKVEVVTQKDMTPDMFQKGVRLDVFARDAENTRYDVEMQTTLMKDLGQRLRYYQARLDNDALRRGEKYGCMKNSYIIFICMEDPLQKGLSRYTIEPRCMETEARVNSGMQWILLNASGDGRGVNKEVQEFLVFAKDSRPDNETNAFLQEIGTEMKEILSGEWGKTIMSYEEKIEMMRRDLLEEGRELGLKETALELRSMGMSVKDIARATKASMEEVQGWFSSDAANQP